MTNMEEKIIKTRGIGLYPMLFGMAIFLLGSLLALNIISIRGAGHGDAELMRGMGIVVIVLSLAPLIYGALLLYRGGELHLTPTGFHDPGMFRNEIPWTELQSVNMGLSNNQRWKAIRLQLTPEAYKAAKVNWLAKLVVADPQNGIGYTGKMVELSLEEFGDEIVTYANEALKQYYT